VDVLAPGPLPAALEADITAPVEGGALAVTVTPKQGGGGGAGAAVEERFVVALPEGCAGGRVTSVKLSRRLGLLTACVTAEL
jgi:predicted RNA-binding protein with TRAM domain